MTSRCSIRGWEGALHLFPLRPLGQTSDWSLYQANLSQLSFAQETMLCYNSRYLCLEPNEVSVRERKSKTSGTILC